MAEDSSSRPEYGPSGRKIIYDEDGKPCRSCNTLLDFKSAMGISTPSSNTHKSSKSAGGMMGAFAGLAAGGAQTKPNTTTTNGYSKDCPPDVEQLGRSSWTLLHTMAARYPEKPSEETQKDMSTFIGLFAKLYPCWFCAEDFQKHIETSKPKVQTQEEFGKWLCDAHNEVNVKLGKEKFDCNLWKQRWKDGWGDDRC
ncbi:CYFA0S01e18448g1_1 [Cyberlindnera fabianii]|uniref:Sulfhydryl oxidase n=1 Tax=Cyberlindnera fabianii TaxID=36022 RepID=A0A061AL38_CYBFA|nr:CYFA0S01e18448g1_1 [Cyberlindnera fabianii]